MDILAVINAEEEADSLIAEAKQRREALVRQAMEERERSLHNIRAPPEPAIKLSSPNGIEVRKDPVRMRTAVKRVLEDLHA